jgi:hypothetical protein
VKRVVILGPGGAGKTTFAYALGKATGLPVIALDKHFWRPGLTATPTDEWIAVQPRAERWIMDGDLGPYDAPSARLARADTIVILDLPLSIRILRVLRRGSERLDFWRWMLFWRWLSRPALIRAIAYHAGVANVHELRSPQAVAIFLNEGASGWIRPGPMGCCACIQPGGIVSTPGIQD